MYNYVDNVRCIFFFQNHKIVTLLLFNNYVKYNISNLFLNE